MPFAVSELADQVLFDPAGVEQRLGDLWSERPEVILFLRHFG
ncbi:MAG: hypothetical protein OEP52_12350 [Acidimicrobiia bacterium]|jgi:hypothetical protein|nr:hypothetical protein [Acidimicrobiia bacterium]